VVERDSNTASHAGAAASVDAGQPAGSCVVGGVLDCGVDVHDPQVPAADAHAGGDADHLAGVALEFGVADGGGRVADQHEGGCRAVRAGVDGAASRGDVDAVPAAVPP